MIAASAFAASATITLPTQLGFRADDTVTLAYPSGATLPSGVIAAGNYKIKTYTASDGATTLKDLSGNDMLDEKEKGTENQSKSDKEETNISSQENDSESKEA